MNEFDEKAILEQLEKVAAKPLLPTIALTPITNRYAMWTEQCLVDMLGIEKLKELLELHVLVGVLEEPGLFMFNRDLIDEIENPET